MKKITVAMSGGIDSSAAVMFLSKNPEYEISGVTLRLFDNNTANIRSKTCCSLEDSQSAAEVAAHLGLPHYVYNFNGVFRREVIEKFCESYIKGETPNPCIDCNNRVKFKYLLERTESLGGDFLATGHYARIEYDPNYTGAGGINNRHKGRWLLKKAVCRDGFGYITENPKDQSYVLYGIPYNKLPKILFPLGDKAKPSVRTAAREHGLLNYDKPDSQDICFIPDGDYAGFIRNYKHDFIDRYGNFLDIDGEVLGESRIIESSCCGEANENEYCNKLTQNDQPCVFNPKHGTFIGHHKGFISYTSGQRRGLGVSFGKPLYVISKNSETGNIILGEEKELFTFECNVHNANWLALECPEQKFYCSAKIRYRSPEIPCSVFKKTEGIYTVIFEKPVRAITPGQHIVFYEDDIVLGGGEICFL